VTVEANLPHGERLIQVIPHPADAHGGRPRFTLARITFADREHVGQHGVYRVQTKRGFDHRKTLTQREHRGVVRRVQPVADDAGEPRGLCAPEDGVDVTDQVRVSQVGVDVE
jgi:hypothetical protein